MKAIVKSRPEPGIWMEDVPVPSIGPNAFPALRRWSEAAAC